MKAQVGQVALAQFQNRDLDTAAQLFVTPDTEGFLSQISTVEKVSENQNSVLQDFQQEQAGLAELEHSAKTDLAALDEQQKELAKLRAASEKKVAESKAVLAKLTAEQQRQIAARGTEGSRRGQGGGRERRRHDVPRRHPRIDDPAVTGSGRGAKALAFARAQLGKPYRFGATGPNAYDCSGLTGAAWRAAGVSLSRTSQSQFHDGRAVSKSDLQPGDLVFFYSGISHVGLYAGNGMILHAPRPGKPRRVHQDELHAVRRRPPSRLIQPSHPHSHPAPHTRRVGGSCWSALAVAGGDPGRRDAARVRTLAGPGACPIRPVRRPHGRAVASAAVRVTLDGLVAAVRADDRAGLPAADQRPGPVVRRSRPAALRQPQRPAAGRPEDPAGAGERPLTDARRAVLGDGRLGPGGDRHLAADRGDRRRRAHVWLTFVADGRPCSSPEPSTARRPIAQPSPAGGWAR